MTNIVILADRRASPPAPQQEPAKRSAPRVNPYSAIRCSAAFDMIAAGIRQLDEYAPTSGLTNLRHFRDVLWAQLPKIEALAVLVEDKAHEAMNEAERA